jgi:competence protein ComGC
MNIKKLKKIQLAVVMISSALIVAIIISVILFVKLNNLKNNIGQVAQTENQNVLKNISKLIILPKDEVPVIATITDMNKLKDQAFFDNAELGDKVLIYYKAKTAVLYNPAENLIINVAPITGGNNSTTSETIKK